MASNHVAGREPTTCRYLQTHYLGTIGESREEADQNFFCLQAKQASHRWFPNVTDLTVSVRHLYSSKPFPPIVNLSKVTKLSLVLHERHQLSSTTSSTCIDLLQRTRNVHWLTFISQSINGDSVYSKDLYSAILRYVDQSKLRHPEIPVENIHQVQMLLKTFQGLLSVRFYLWGTSLTARKIIEHVETVRPGCSITEWYTWVSIWLGNNN
jgi:hypothetical protein